MRSLWKRWSWYWFDRRMKKQWKKMVADCQPVQCPKSTVENLTVEFLPREQDQPYFKAGNYKQADDA